MDIIIVGAGRVGSAIARRLSDDGHDITIIDKNKNAVDKICDEIDCMGVIGNGIDYKILEEAGIKDADVFIAMTDSDELNLLLCLIARETSNKCKNIARVRDPVFRKNQREFIRDTLGISYLINPEFTIAKEISILLFSPYASEVDTLLSPSDDENDKFSRDKIELLSSCLPDNSPLIDKQLKDCFSKAKGKLLICAIERDGKVIIPSGDTYFRKGDKISYVTSNKDAGIFLKSAKITNDKIKEVIIAGGSTISYYLAKRLTNFNIDVKIIEESSSRCEHLEELLPSDVEIINGDPTDPDIFAEIRAHRSDAFVALTESDEKNMMLSLYAKNNCNLIPVTNINKLNFDGVIESLNIGKVINPGTIIAENVGSFVRSLDNAEGSNFRSIFSFSGGKAFGIEFEALPGSKVLNCPMSDIRRDVMLCCICRGSKYFIPSGNDTIKEGDFVFVITSNKNMNSLDEILI